MKDCGFVIQIKATWLQAYCERSICDRFSKLLFSCRSQSSPHCSHECRETRAIRAITQYRRAREEVGGASNCTFIFFKTVVLAHSGPHYKRRHEPYGLMSFFSFVCLCVYRSEAASKILNSSAGRQRSYVLSAAKKYEYVLRNQV